jgi:hypothetical protein
MPLVLTKSLKKSDKKDLAHFIIPRAEQKNNVAIDSVFIHETLDNFMKSLLICLLMDLVLSQRK